jgi:hypothetical protein
LFPKEKVSGDSMVLGEYHETVQKGGKGENPPQHLRIPEIETLEAPACQRILFPFSKPPTRYIA